MTTNTHNYLKTDIFKKENNLSKMTDYDTDYTAIFPYQYKPLSYVDFDSIQPSTRTCLAKLHTNVELKKFYENANVIDGSQPKIKRKKIKIQQLERKHPGAIISMLYNGECRGVKTRQHPKPFLNQLTFIMSLDTTNVNFKLFHNGRIQATGCKTRQHELDIIHYLVEEGRRIEQATGEIIFASNPVMDDCQTVMINIDFNLGFNIDRNSLNRTIAGLNGFQSIFNENLTNSGVTIKMPREISDKKDTFICFHTGTVLLSGDDLTRMKEIYYKFLETVDSIKTEIVTSQSSITLQKRKLRVVLV